MKNKVRRPYHRAHGPLPADQRRKEWVELPDGDICLWELTTAEMLQMRDHAERPSIDPRGGYSMSAAAVWMVALSARESDEEGARRVWDDLSFEDIYQLPWRDYMELAGAARRVNGIAAEEVEQARDFTPAPEAPNSSESSASASKSSTASLPRSMSPTTN